MVPSRKRFRPVVNTKAISGEVELPSNPQNEKGTFATHTGGEKKLTAPKVRGLNLMKADLPTAPLALILAQHVHFGIVCFPLCWCQI